MKRMTCATLLLLCVGCQSAITGNEGNLDFSYAADDNLINFNKPIAVGAKLKLRVNDTENKLPAILQSATSDDDGVLAVDSFENNELILEGIAPGSALISVEAKNADGDELPDSVNMLAAEAEKTSLRHYCDLDGDEAFYIAGRENIVVLFELMKANDDPVIGYGLRPFEVEPATAATIRTDNTDQASLHLDLGALADAGTDGVVTLKSTIDDTTLTMNFAEEVSIDGIAINQATKLNVNVDDTHLAHFWPTVGGVNICQSGAEMTVETSTPENCEVRAATDVPETEINDGSGWISVKGVAEGTCTFEITYPNAGVMGVTESFDFNITPKP